MSRKNLIIMIVAFIVEVLITYFIASFFSVRFIEVMFFTGIVFAGGTFYFSSSGELCLDYLHLKLVGKQA
ncbi:hypothetical protein ABH966_000534 [Lysinibacillus sp. RC46]|uniref:hypothetical protein n=1 Tax=Lysinibacillus sp. RC46 TaxID=3156295 RepID=UPI003513F4BB